MCNLKRTPTHTNTINESSSHVSADARYIYVASISTPMARGGSGSSTCRAPIRPYCGCGGVWCEAVSDVHHHPHPAWSYLDMRKITSQPVDLKVDTYRFGFIAAKIFQYVHHRCGAPNHILPCVLSVHVF